MPSPFDGVDRQPVPGRFYVFQLHVLMSCAVSQALQGPAQSVADLLAMSVAEKLDEVLHPLPHFTLHPCTLEPKPGSWARTRG